MTNSNENYPLPTLPSQEMPRKVKVGVLIDSSQSAVWIHDMLRRIQASDYAEIVQVVENTSSDDVGMTGIRRLHHIWKRLGYILFSRVGRKISNVRDDPFEPQSIRELLANANWIPVEPKRKGFVDRFRDEDIARMEQDDVDVYLRLGFGILKGPILNVGRLGIWSYHHGDNRYYRGLPPGFWESYNSEPVTAVTLQVLCEDLDGGSVLYRAFTKTNNIYPYRTICSLYWKSSVIVPRVLKKLHRVGIEAFERETAESNNVVSYHARPLYSYPTNWQTLLQLARTAHRFMCHKYFQIFFCEQWRLMYRTTVPDQPNNSMWRYIELCPPKDRFWADPFVLTVGGVHHLFFEELIYSEDRGTIAHLSIDSLGKVSGTTTVMEKPYHLSYPFIFEHKGDIYMIPESSENKTVDLYRCCKFPCDWEHVKTLIDDTELVDATLVFHDDLWWMFAGQRDDKRVSVSDELSIFYADDFLTGNWTPHPGNPVVSDVRNARPAGKIFSKGGILYRPAQDGRHTYGGAVEIRKIDLLSKVEYKESSATRLDPNWRSDLSGLHTLNKTDEITVIDILTRQLRIRSFFGLGRSK